MIAQFPKHPRNSAAHASKKRVIVVDDDEAVLTSLKFALELEGFETRTFPDAQTLLRKPVVGCHDLLIVDYRLPDTNGLDLVERLRAKGVSAPAILVTSNPSTYVRRWAAALGVPILEKPLLDNSLVAMIKKGQLPSTVAPA